ncbi:MAG TPA: LysR substrate-binding domain-containing protein [Rhizobiaceae bacterium]
MLPPLSALRCFDVAARSENFSIAADKLRLTPSAVSHQIKALETFLGQPLFIRIQRRTQLTDAGRAYAARIETIFQELEEATKEFLRSSAHIRLMVRVPPSLANSWLMPLLAEFIRRHPNVEVQVLTDGGASGKSVDCEIRYGQSKWPGVVAELLWTERLYPMVGPDGPKITTPGDLEGVTLIHTRSRHHGWAELLAAHDLIKDPEKTGIEFDRSVLALEAAASGMGVVLESPLIARRLIESGALSMPLPEVGIEDEAYYFVTGQAGLSKAASLFKEWLLEHVPAQHAIA